MIDSANHSSPLCELVTGDLGLEGACDWNLHLQKCIGDPSARLPQDVGLLSESVEPDEPEFAVIEAAATSRSRAKERS
jgi:hypothetical protein